MRKEASVNRKEQYKKKEMREEEVKRRKVKGKEKQIGKKKEEQRWESEISNAIRNKKESGNDEGK